MTSIDTHGNLHSGTTGQFTGHAHTEADASLVHAAGASPADLLDTVRQHLTESQPDTTSADLLIQLIDTGQVGPAYDTAAQVWLISHSVIQRERDTGRTPHPARQQSVERQARTLLTAITADHH